VRRYGAAVEVVSRFAELVAAPDPRLDVALALIAAIGRPEVDPDTLVGALDTLARQVEPGDPAQVCAQLFSQEGTGLGGDRSDYYDPRNSLLDQVLERRVGVPITLSVIGIEVARRHGLTLRGVGMPGHFLLAEERPGRYFDAFDGGRALDANGARELFRSLHGPGQTFDTSFLSPVSSTMIIIRVLNNLRGAHLRRGDRSGLAAALALQGTLPGVGLAARQDLAGVLAADGRFLDAAAVHDTLASDLPQSAAEHRTAAQQLRARLN